MKVCIPFKPAPSGGTSIFFKKFSRALVEYGFEATNVFSADCDVLLAIAAAPLTILAQAKLRKIPIVQRLDGIYYPANAGRRWLWLNKRILPTYKFFADRIIFQSEYSRQVCEYFFGKASVPFSTIHNGVDLNRFAPHGETKKLVDGQVILCLLSNFIRSFEILPVLQAFDYLHAQHPQTQLVVAGKFVPKLQHIPESRPDVIWLGTVAHHELPALYRQADLMLSTKLRHNCPNAVLEAMACGLPIACFDSGAHRELIADKGGICVPLNDGFGAFPKLDAKLLAGVGEVILQNQKRFSQQAYRHAKENFGLECMMEQYIAVLKNTIQER